VHHDQLWGDINLVNGQPWPFLDISASWQRFRILNADISRPRILMVGFRCSLVCSSPAAKSALKKPSCPCATTYMYKHSGEANIMRCPATIVQIRDDAGTEISSKICHIIGSDGGSLPYATDHPWPSTGMMTDVAYRWDVVCDFSAYTGRVC
jgi:FtsP/CotA-like multicopper oxidase with cupredoxin domain